MALNKSIFFILCIKLLMSSNTKNWIRANTIAEFDKQIWIKPLVVAILYDSEQCNFCQKYLPHYDSLITDPMLQNHNFGFVSLDLNNNTLLKKTYKLDRKSNLLLFIKGRPVHMVDFHDNQIIHLQREMKNDEMIDKVKHFLLEKIHDINKQITDIDHFNELISQKRIIILYLGSKNKQFDIYNNIAQRNFTDDFYYSINLELRKAIFEMYDKLSLYEDDFVLAIRSEPQLDDFDTDIFKYIDFNREIMEIERFTDLERYPKYRSNLMADTNIHQLLHRDYQILLFVRSSPVNLYVLKKFKAAVKRLPKEIIFTYSDMNMFERSRYASYFKRNKVRLVPNYIYMLYMSKGKGIEVQSIEGGISDKLILKFVLQFYESKGSILGPKIGEYVNKKLEYLRAEIMPDQNNDEL